jgi:ribosomal protein S18 acetylase RimI-like enzyme
MRIETAAIDDIPLIQAIADRTWRESFKAVISLQQIEYMLHRMYTHEVLRWQMKEGKQVFLLAHEEEQCAGFASYELDANEDNHARLHKLFVLPELQKSGAGSLLLEEVVGIVKEHKNDGLLLSVNRQNPAVNYYLNRGFEIVEEDDIAIGNGYIMKDYFMFLNLK